MTCRTDSASPSRVSAGELVLDHRPLGEQLSAMFRCREVSEVRTSLRQRLSTLFIVAIMAGLLALSWTSIAFAQAAGDSDGLDSDELGLPIVVGVGILAYLGWIAFRRRSRKSS